MLEETPRCVVYDYVDMNRNELIKLRKRSLRDCGVPLSLDVKPIRQKISVKQGT